MSGQKNNSPIQKLMVFGATGDLTGRFLLPALAHLHSAKRLPEGFSMIGASVEDWNDETFRTHCAQSLEQHADEVSEASRKAIVQTLSYRQIDFKEIRSLDFLDEATGSGPNTHPPVVAYLALPTQIYLEALNAIDQVGLPIGSRIVVEKPFGQDLKSAIALNSMLKKMTGPDCDQAIFRVDHALALACVRNIPGLRFRNHLFQDIWNSSSIEQVDILWEEILGLEGRASFYDQAGALRDVMQNHLMQVLCLIAMEPPANPLDSSWSDQKLELLRAIRPLSLGEIKSRTRRARYTAGALLTDDGSFRKFVPSYVDEEGVDPRRSTESFGEILLEINTPRWNNTRFCLRAGKALARRRKEVVIRFRQASSRDFKLRLADETTNEAAIPRELRIGLDGPNDIRLFYAGNNADFPSRPTPLVLVGSPPSSELPAYSRVLLNILSGESSLSVKAEETEMAWQIMTPIAQAWADNQVPLEEYVAGSDGPPWHPEKANHLLEPM